jgi:hypothetical protein
MPWQNAPVLQKLTAAQNGGNLGAQLWGVDNRGKLYTIYQKSPGGQWSNWITNEWAPVNHPKYVYELAACQLGDGRIKLWTLDHKHEIWTVEQNGPGGGWNNWWHDRPTNKWNRYPAPFKKLAAVHMAKFQGSLSDWNGGAMFIGLKDDGRLAVCYSSGHDSWSRFRDNWNGAAELIEVTACQLGATERVGVWALDNKNQLWACFEETKGTGNFSGWVGPNWLNVPKLRNIAAFEGSWGGVIVGQDMHYNLVAYFQDHPSSDNWQSWQGWNAPAGYELTACGQNNGLAQVWAVTLKQQLTSIAQVNADWPSRWSDYDPQD